MYKRLPSTAFKHGSLRQCEAIESYTTFIGNGTFIIHSESLLMCVLRHVYRDWSLQDAAGTHREAVRSDALVIVFMGQSAVQLSFSLVEAAEPHCQ